MTIAEDRIDLSTVRGTYDTVPPVVEPTSTPAWTRLLPLVVQEAVAAPAHPLNRLMLRLDVVAHRLALTTAERVIVACLLAQDIDEDIHGRVMRDRSAHACTRSDLLHFVDGDTAVMLEALVRLEARGIVRAGDDVGQPWAATPVAITAAIRFECLRGREGGALTIAPDLLPRVACAIAAVVSACQRTASTQLHVVIRGRRGSGRDSTLATLLGRLGATGYVRTPIELRGDSDTLEPELSGRAAVWDGRAVAIHPDDLAHAAAFLARSTTVCVSVVDIDDDVPVVPGRVAMAIETDPYDLDERASGWMTALLRRTEPEMCKQVAALMSTRTRAGTGLAHHVSRVVAEPMEPTPEAWSEALLAQLETALQPSALRGLTVERPAVTRRSVVIDQQTGVRIEQMVAMMRNASLLATPTRRGVKALLSGPSGTGKTLTARCVAGELGRPLFRVDLATVVSKWVGETEKNLRSAMQAAEATGAVLLFDEGDALFGARSEITRGADRYANMEVSYLLQALELLDGLVVVTTNLRTNIDRAFLRRFDVIIDFQRPDARLRAALWRQELGAEATRVSDDTLDRIATQTELTGGHIAVACRLARALALSRGEPLGDEHLLDALVTELRAVGSNVAASRWKPKSTRTGRES